MADKARRRMSVDVGGLALSLSEAGNEGSGGGWIGGDVPEALGSEYVHPCFRSLVNIR